jgi:hypothetical protein
LATVAQVNLPVATLVWLMIIPMLLKIDLAALGEVRAHWRGIAVTVGVNWLVKPFSMALLGWLFLGYLFRPFLPAGQIDAYIAGLILLAAAPCTAMVFVWSNLVEGEPHFTLSQVALNDSIMIVAFAPIVALLPAARPVLDHRAVEHAFVVGRALYRSAGDLGATLAAHAAGERRTDRAGPDAPRLGSFIAFGAAADAHSAVRPARRADHAPSRSSSRCWRCRS